jgi:hypothetical protein
MKASFENKKTKHMSKDKNKCTIDVYVVVCVSWEPLHET